MIYRDETFTFCIIEVEENFSVVELRLTPGFRREMRLTKFILLISSTNKAGNFRVGTNSLDLYMHYHLNISLVFEEGSLRSN